MLTDDCGPLVRKMIPRYVGQAVIDGDIDLVKAWLTSGERDLNEDVEGSDYGWSLLHLSLAPGERGRPDRSQLVTLLLDYGADENAISLDLDEVASETPLTLCMHPDEAEVLLDHGANIEAQVSSEVRPLHAAVLNYALMHLLVRRGANVFAKSVHDCDAEANARNLAAYEGLPARFSSPELLKSADFLAAVKLDGGWQKYLRAPRIELVRLRSLCDRGRAAPCSTASSAKLGTLQALSVAEMMIFERMFGPSATKSPRGPSNRLPNEIFWNILTFWRSSRDELPP